MSTETLSPTATSTATPDESTMQLDVILDVKVKLTVQIGSCLLSMKEVLELSPGTVVQLEQNTTEPVCLLANGKPIGYGEVVVVDKHFGIKITQLLGASRNV
jgi:flagellar motor switch protein FliN/FliY